MYRRASCACNSIGRPCALPVVRAAMKEERVAAWRVCASTVSVSLGGSVWVNKVGLGRGRHVRKELGT